MNRLINIAIIICFLLLKSNCAFAKPDEEQTSEIDVWITEMMSGTKSTTGVLILQRFKDSMYIVVKPFTWKSDDPSLDYQKVTVPSGFVTDLTSVPPLFWSTLRPDGNYVNAAIAHDYLYWTQERDRQEADKILSIIMKEFGIGWIKRNTIFQAVDKLGWLAWSKNKELKLSGEKRYLKRFPQDPKITWSQWKLKKSVFQNEPLTEK